MTGMTAVAAFVAEAAVSAAISYAISYALAEDGPKTTGARVDDLGVQKSSYGEFIPIVYGQMRLAGNIISMENNQLKETAYTQDRGGKGGPDAGSHTTFIYSGTWDVALCEGPIDAIRRRWADASLIYDSGAAASATTKYASDQVINDANFYYGDGANIADPIVQGYLGIAETPNYDGICHVVDEDFQVGKFGNRVPNMTFEVISSGTSSALNLVVALDKIGNSEGRVIDGLLYRAKRVTVGGRTQKRIWRHDLDGNEIDSTDHDIHDFDDGTTVASEFFTCQNDPRWTVVRRGGVAGKIGLYFEGNEQGNLVTDWENTTGGSQYYCIASNTQPVRTTDFFVVIQGQPATGHKLATFAIESNGTTIAASATKELEIVGTGSRYVWADVDDYIYLVRYDSQWIIEKYTQGLVLVDSWSGVPTPERRSAVWNGNWIRSSSGAASSTYLTTLNSDGTFTNVTNIDPPETDNVTQLSRSLYLTDGGIVSLGDVEPDSVSVGDIVSDLFSKAGLSGSPTIVDISLLTERCYGYAITTYSTIRSNIEPLMTAFQFDMVEEDYVLKCVPRGGASSLTIPESDLAARMYNEQTPQTLVIMEAQETELPKRVNVSYLDVYRDYEKGLEFAEREVTTSENVVNIELPIAMQAQQAAELADKLLAEAWVGKYTYKFTLPKKYSYLEPTNVITIELDNGESHEMRITSVAEGVSGIIEVNAVASSSAVYTSYATTEEGPTATTEISIPGPANVELLDIPMLRDQDNDAGFYTACSGYLSGFQGAQLYKSNNGGETYVHYEALTKRATMGLTTDALADASSEVWDYVSTVNVKLNYGTLSSSTRAEIEAGANVCAIGDDGRWEIIKFQTATLESDGSYTLSGLIRGYRGTEQHTGTHQAGDVFILLTTGGIDRADGSASEIGSSRAYQVIPYAALPETIANPQQFDFTNNGNALKPFSPVLIKGTRDANEDLTIEWTRRTRLSGEWRDYVDVPLGEATESYSIDILDGSTVVRTITATTETATYTAAQQVTDFGSTQSAVSVKIYQISETVGRGFPGEATI